MAHRRMKSAFSAASTDELRDRIDTTLRARVLDFPRQQLEGPIHAHKLSLPRSEFWYCAYGVPLTLQFPEADYYRLQVPQGGRGETRVGCRTSSVGNDRSCVSASDATISFGENFSQLVWRIPTDLLVRKLSLLIDRPLGARLEFDLDYDLSSPTALPLAGMLNAALDVAALGDRPGAKMQMTEIEEAMATALLCSARHNYRAIMDDPVSGAAPWQVARVENYIEANWNKPLQIEELVAETGASARSIFRTFKHYRGYSPMDFLKRRRLEHAMLLLGDPACEKSVTDIAFDCGFNDLSRFSRDFLAAFGVKPSAVRRRARGRISAAED